MRKELVMQDSLEQFNGDQLAADVFIRKYSKDGVETVHEMQLRLAKNIAKARFKRIFKVQDSNFNLSEKDKTVYNNMVNHVFRYLKDFKYIVPQGSIMATLGTGKNASLSNCFVVGQPHDSIGGILKKDEELAQLMKRRGGVGIDLSSLRVAGATTNNAAESSTGPVSFAPRYSNTTREIAQGGRRGALMITMSINHPDSLKFARAKSDSTSITGANISIKITDRFMKAVKDDSNFVQIFPERSRSKFEEKIKTYVNKGSYELNRLYTEKLGDDEVSFRVVSAKDTWRDIISVAHNWGEPGIIFEDKHLAYSPDTVYTKYKGVTVNPCGEIWIPAYDACRLIALNLLSFVDWPYTPNAAFNFQKFRDAVKEAMVMGADIIDLEIEAIDKILTKINTEHKESRTEEELWRKIRGVAKDGRRIGLGFTALGDTFAALNIRYGSAKSIDLTRDIMKDKFGTELRTSIDLAKKHSPFIGWTHYNEFTEPMVNTFVGRNRFYDMIAIDFPLLIRQMKEHGRYNVSWSTVNGGLI